MIHLSGKIEILTEKAPFEHGLLKITTNKNLPIPLRKKYALLSESSSGDGFQAVLRKNATLAANTSAFRLSEEIHHLGDDDVVAFEADSTRLRVLYRRLSNQNSILLTERCNHYCLMCSQPPKTADDSYLMKEVKELIRLIPDDTLELGFTGGEPTLYGDEFIDLLRICKSYLPRTALHILSNGRTFKDFDFAKKYAEVSHPDIMIGIPIYSDDPVTHNFIVQSENAFNETIKGILNLKSLGQRVEIRVVLQRYSVERLEEIANFIARNLLFVDHVALMGLEIMGFTRANLDELWVDQYDYKDKLSAAVNLLSSYGVNVSVYNHQRCLVNDDVMHAYRKSISDWKNEYLSECKECTKQTECGGFFASQIKYRTSKYIQKFNA
jgi:His-Xaa-Ser system radical SAM maturase HxsC